MSVVFPRPDSPARVGGEHDAWDLTQKKVLTDDHYCEVCASLGDNLVPLW